MAKHKISRKSTRIDMTAMCDVAFLLLSFFVMTATAKQPEPKPVDTPASTVIDKLPEDGVAVITVGDSSVFFTIPRSIRRGTLERVADLKKVSFSETDYKKFDGLEGFGVPLGKLKSLLELKGEARNRPGIQEGIPFDSINDQLGMWVEQAREANKQYLNDKIAAGDTEVKFKDLDIAIKGDAKESYPTIKRVIDILQAQHKNRFFLVTGLRNEDF
ncbi:ExbD/TolR family protein [Flavobacterium sp. RHBU_24]|uniref:ExbD/TolR family protein n=1 Tax=Flavobacterium sp. RHBU_24 TaxID=3391185 RepID=UPI0039846C6A